MRLLMFQALIHGCFKNFSQSRKPQEMHTTRFHELFLKNFEKNLNRFSVSNFKFYEGDIYYDAHTISARSDFLC